MVDLGEERHGDAQQRQDWDHDRCVFLVHMLEEPVHRLGLAHLKKDGWIEGLGSGSRLEIHVPRAVDRAQHHRAAAPTLDRRRHHEPSRSPATGAREATAGKVDRRGSYDPEALDHPPVQPDAE
jgi:hypothetical protein